MTWLDGKALRKGQKGEMVGLLQDMLDYLGYFDGNFDGVFDRDTLYAVKTLQGDNGLIVDGVVGRQTMDAINSICEEDGWDEVLS
jgi:peptidoglycan hydrolase-like protein with peptidoglycan-binding domain